MNFDRWKQKHEHKPKKGTTKEMKNEEMKRTRQRTEVFGMATLEALAVSVCFLFVAYSRFHVLEPAERVFLILSFLFSISFEHGSPILRDLNVRVKWRFEVHFFFFFPFFQRF
jgi:hypothetical protein